MTSVSAYLDIFCNVLVVVSVWSIYRGSRDLTSRPLLIAVIGAVLILAGKLVPQFESSLVFWTGNLLIVGAALW